jgi:hypothetical protein
MSSTAEQREALRPSGPAAAVVLATGVGAFVLGLFTTLAAASSGINDFLNFADDVGPLSGKSIFATIAFFAAWAVLYGVWRGREVVWRPVLTATIVLLALGFLGTFPTFFEAFD